MRDSIIGLGLEVILEKVRSELGGTSQSEVTAGSMDLVAEFGVRLVSESSALVSQRFSNLFFVGILASAIFSSGSLLFSFLRLVFWF